MEMNTEVGEMLTDRQTGREKSPGDKDVNTETKALGG